MMMPLGSISNETRVNIYNQKEKNKKEKEGKIMTGRCNLGVVPERVETKKCYTSCRQGLSGNSLTELLTGLRPKTSKKPQIGEMSNSKLNKNLDLVYRKTQTSGLQKRSSKSDNRALRAKLAKSQPKLQRQRINNSYSYVNQNTLKKVQKSYLDASNHLRQGSKKENKLYHSFKKKSKENKIINLNNKSYFKKKKSNPIISILQFVRTKIINR